MKHSTAKELLGCLNIAVLAEIKIHCPALFIDRTIEIYPAPLDLDIGFIYPPRTPDRLGILPPSFLKFRDEPLDPAHDRRMRHRQPALGHHFDEIAVAKLIADVPLYTERDDQAVEVAAFK